MEYLNQNEAFFLEARVFTNLLNLQEFLEHALVDILLIGEAIALENVEKEHIQHIMVLSEHGVVREGSEYPFLYKYQSMDGLVKEIAMCYTSGAVKVIQAIAEAEKTKTLIGVFSPFGGSGKTLFSLALGQALAEGVSVYENQSGGNTKSERKYQKVLYMGMEMVSSFQEEENIRGNLSDILYWIRERKEGCLSGVALMAEKKGDLDCIFSPDHFRDLLDVTEEDMEFLLSELYKNTTYDTIIFDIGCWNPAMLYLLEQMDEIYMPDFLNRNFLKKESSFLNSLHLTGKSGLHQKIKKAELPFDEMIYQGNFDLNKVNKTKMGQYVCRLIKKNSI